MSATTLVIAILVVLVVAVAIARLLDRRAISRRRVDVAGAYLAESVPHGDPIIAPLPRWLTVLVAAASIVGALGVGIAQAGRDDGAAQRRSDDIASCRSEYRARIDVADHVTGDLESKRVDLIAAVVVSAVSGDKAGQEDAAKRLEGAADTVAKARARANVVTDTYQRAVRLASDDPDRFLENCAGLTSSTTVPAAVKPFRSCAAAVAAGAAPLRRGEPGFSSDLDRDGDGVACE